MKSILLVNFNNVLCYYIINKVSSLFILNVFEYCAWKHRLIITSSGFTSLDF